MNNTEYIHETILRDIVDITMDVKDKSDIIRISKGKSFRSVSQATSNLILTFPVLMSRSVASNIENAAMVCKSIERTATSLMQILFSAVSLDNADNAIDFVKQYHTNLNTKNGLSVDEFIDIVDDYASKLESRDESFDRYKYEAIKEDIKNISKYLGSNVNENSINDFTLYRSLGENVILQEAKDKGNKYQINADAITFSIPNGTSSGGDKGLSTKDILAYNKNNVDRLSRQVIDTDVKKANELMPTLMIIQFQSTSASDKDIAIMDNIVIGIKAKMELIDSDDIINRIKIKNKDNNGFHQLIRATTREISFWKDFVFAIDVAKVDAISNSKRGSSSKLWKILERRAKKSKIRRNLNMINDASAISTLVVSSEEVEYLKKEEGINMNNPSIARPIMESYNLMGFCIVDDTMETAKFLFDSGDDTYETVSFSHLERESSDNTYKKVVNLMTKYK